MALVQVHPKDLEAPLPAVSVLLEGKVNIAVLLMKVIDSKVALEASISRKAHHEATMANRLGWQGPFLTNGASLSSSSFNLKNGSSDACFAGPRPRAAARDNLRM